MASKTPDSAHVWKMIKYIDICMFVTRTETGFDGRPYSSNPDPDAGAIYFLTERGKVAAQEIAADSRVMLTYADKGRNDYVVIEGEAVLLEDRAKVHEYWSAFAKAWWEGPDDPRIQLIEVRPKAARYWDSPGAMAATLSMLGAAVTGQSPDMGQQGETRL